MTTTTRPRALIPTGTARALFLGAAAADQDAALPNDLRVTLSDHDVSAETLWATWEVATWAADAPAADRRALACLVAALLEGIAAGGTFLPLQGTSDGASDGASDSLGARRQRSHTDALGEALRRLGIGDADRRAAHALASALINGSAPPAVAALVGAPGTRAPFVLSDGHLYSERFWHIEDHLIARIRAHMNSPIPDFFASRADSIDSVIATVNDSAGAIRLTNEQTVAVRAALTQSLTIVTGGPGTGKTSTVVGILRALARVGIPGERIALAAPTGRAARRMKESVEAALAGLQSPAPVDVDLAARFPGATTLHRLLGIRSGRTRVLEPAVPEFYEAWPLPAQIVIVDEASMIDLVLMDQLVSALGPRTRLILIGDVNQLPSVQVGAAFRDFVKGAPAITCHLTRSHRMNPLQPAGSEILQVATAINAGLPPPAAIAHIRTDAATLTFSGFEQLAPGHLDAFLDRWYREILAADTRMPVALNRRFIVDGDVNAGKRLVTGAGHSVSGQVAGDDDQNAFIKALLLAALSARILCVTREAGRTTSAQALNRLMHTRVQRTAIQHGATESWQDSAFLPGEPVIVLRNDPARGLSNGDLGVVVRVRTSRADGLGVAFSDADGFVVHPLDAISRTLGLAHALTVHKAQGSEYDRIALVLPDVDVPLLTREVVYTALTRARDSVVVIGDHLLLGLAATRPLARTSGIGAKLAGNPED